MADAKFHHYLPKMLQRNFTDADYPEGHEPFVWLRDVGSDEWCPSAPKNVGAENHFYRIPEPDPPLRFEKAFEIIETAVAPVLRKLWNRAPVSENEMHQVAFFAAQLKLRVPAHLALIDANLRAKGMQLRDEYVEFMKNNLEFFASTKRDWAAHRGSDVPQFSPEDLRFATPVPSRGGLLQQALAPCLELAAIIRELSWTVWHSVADHFILSDDPVLLGRDRFGEIGVFCLPISRSAVIIGTSGGQAISHVDAHRPLVGYVNHSTEKTATRFIISPKPGYLSRTKAAGPLATFRQSLKIASY